MGVINTIKNKLTKKKFYTIDDIEIGKIQINLLERKSVKIVFVDDDGYDIKTIKRLGYKDVDKMFKFGELADFEKYDVIFCDVNGVAVDLDPKYQGAELAKQIKEVYPNKMVIIYSSKEQGLNITKYREYVDAMIEKNTKPAEIADYIDSYIKKRNNPKIYWTEEVKRQLIKIGLDNDTIKIVENYYVKSILERTNYATEMNRELQGKGIKVPVLDLIQTAFTIIQTYLAIKGA